MKKVLIFGSGGMAGHVVYAFLSSLKKYNIKNVAYPSKVDETSVVIDVENMDKVAALVKDFRPNVIINCVGLLNKACDENPDKAVYVNSFFPHYLSKLAKNISSRVIHLSTDCVFSGSKGSYVETDFKDGNDIYSKSKALGELINDTDLTIRTSIIGPELNINGIGLFNWFMKQKGIIQGYSQVYWTGVTTLELAKALDKAIESNLTGLYHLVPSSKISKHDLLMLIGKVWNKVDVDIKKNNDKKADKSLINTRKDFDFKVKDYEAMLLELFSWINERKTFYHGL